MDEITQAGLLLEQIFATHNAADKLLDHHFRTHRSGQLQRRHIGALVYCVLRFRDLLEARHHHHFPGLPPTLKSLTAMAAMEITQESGATPPHWPPPLPPIANIEEPFPIDQLPPWKQVSLPPWIWESWLRQFGQEETQALAKALNSPGMVDIRVNIRKTTRQALQNQLESLGILSQATPCSPDGLRLQGRPALSTLAPFQQGFFEVQDEGSQLIGHLVAPQPGMTVIDFCAGAGGKSLHMATLMADRGRVWAIDTDAKRLQRLNPRSKRGGLKCITPLTIRHEGDRALKKLQGGALRVLVDAPCSATGTLRRNPDIKWRLTPDALETFHMRQCAILQAAARLVAPKGRLIYATCSLMARENEEVVNGFLAEYRDFHLRPHSQIASLAACQGLHPTSPFFTLHPHRSQTDGFFAAILERKS
ncbi:MAG: RsmB/NOP family class I SAM-dependent RNA methyltransferase [Magnetococcus sp. THC-1_WYH]